MGDLLTLPDPIELLPYIDPYYIEQLHESLRLILEQLESVPVLLLWLLALNTLTQVFLVVLIIAVIWRV